MTSSEKRQREPCRRSAAPRRRRRASLLGVLALLALVGEARAGLERISSLALAGARPTSMALDHVRGLLLVGTRPTSTAAELHAIDLADPARPVLAWTLELGAKVHAIACHGALAFVATGDAAAELVVVDVTRGVRVGSFDAEGSADGLSVKLVTPGIVRLGRRISDAPEAYRLDVEDPRRIAVVDSAERSRSLRPPPVKPLAGYAHHGHLVGRGRLPGSSLTYVVTTERGAEVQVVASTSPVAFADLNGDGVYRLGCLGDSNTSAVLGPRWCEMVHEAVGVAEFEIVNVAQAGATVTPSAGAGPDADAQMATVLALEPDAVVLAFGTNDRLLGRAPAAIHDAYRVQAANAAAAGVAFFVATTPPLGGCVGVACPLVFELNAMLHATFGAAVLEFFDGFTGQYMNRDGIHVNPAGQALRAERALAVLAPAD